MRRASSRLIAEPATATVRIKEGHSRDCDPQPIRGEHVLLVDRKRSRVRNEASGDHGRVVHPGDGEPHHHAPAHPNPLCPVRPVQPVAERQPERGEGRRHGDEDGCDDETRVPVDPGGHPHAPHADVVHPGDRCAHGERGEEHRRKRDGRAARDEQGQRGGEDRDDGREGHERNVVGDRHPRHTEGEHAHEVHAPDPHTHRERAGREPREPGSAPRDGHAAGEIERSVRGEARHEDGKSDENGIVATVHGRAPRPRISVSHGKLFRACWNAGVRHHRFRRRRRHRTSAGGRIRKSRHEPAFVKRVGRMELRNSTEARPNGAAGISTSPVVAR
jgi:hypothetical protein